MRYHSLLPGALALSTFWLAACGNDSPTEPTQAAEPTPGGPELALASNSWITRANMPSNRTELATATVTNAAGQSILYAIGGLSPTRVPVAKVTAYNVATNSWTFRRPLPVPLAMSNGAGVINGKVYISGGYSDYGGDFPSKALYMYDPAANTWTRKQDMPETSQYYDRLWVGTQDVTGVINGKLYVITPCSIASEPWGYYEGCGGHPAPWFFRYNPVTDRWTTLPSPFDDPSNPPASPYTGGVIDGKFYVMAGSFYNNGGRFAVYDPASNQWTTKTPLALARPGAATAVQDAKLFVMGGRRYNAARDAVDLLDITIVYDPATDAWTRRAALPSPRSGIAASRVWLNGKPRIEVVGGISPGNNLQYIP